MKCRNCGLEINNDDKFCVYCGKENKNIISFCPKCGREIKYQNKFCEKCGYEFEKYQKSNNAKKNRNNAQNNKINLYAIMGLVLLWINPLVCLILSTIGLFTSKTKTDRVLSLVGIFFPIIEVIILLFFYFLIMGIWI